MNNILPTQRRWLALDIMKVIAIVVMILGHVSIMYASAETYVENFSIWLIFLSEGLGAPPFVFAMGVSIILTKKKSFSKIIYRGILLIIVGYLLNLAKFYPTIVWFKTFPEVLFVETGRVNDTKGLIEFLLIGDILQFAGISYIICALVHHWKKLYENFDIIGLLLAVVTFVISPILYTDDYTPFSYILQFFYGKNFQVYFPIFPWIGFAFLGMAIARWYQKNNSKEGHLNLVKILLPIGILLFLIGLYLIKKNQAYFFGTDYYHRGIGGLIMYCGQLLATLSIYHFITPYLHKHFLSFAIFCSRNVTLIYIIQWLLVYWGWCFIPFGTQTWSTLSFYIPLYIVITLLITLLVNYFIKKIKN